MNENYRKSLEKAKSNKKLVKQKLQQLDTSNSGVLDFTFHKLHEEVFAKTDCLDCANCCKTTSPIFEQQDIDRVAKRKKITTGEFITKYLYMDEEGDFVLQNAPCSFLNTDNTCGIYDVRPKACSEYPHTNRKKMHEILDLTYENAFVCPAVSEIIRML